MSGPRNILFLGEIGPGQTSRMRMRALERLGHRVIGVDTMAPWRRSSWIGRQVQRRLRRGPTVNAINEETLRAAAEFNPDLVWAEKQEFLSAETVAALRRRGAQVVHFTPDPYFSLAWKRTATMDAALAEFDAIVYCKAYEAAEYERLGKPLIYMPLGYCDEVHRPLPSSDPAWSCDVGFLGGWEPRRERLLRRLTGCGVRLGVRGVHWEFLRDGRWTLRRQIILSQFAGGEPFSIHKDEALTAAMMGGEVYADDYARALTGARIGLGLLRQVCPDQHTTRTFEIPACGSMLLGDRTAEHQEFFTEGVEAEYFGSEQELIDKVTFYARNEAARARIAEGGRSRCIRSGYAYVHRLERALVDVAAAR